MTTANKITVVRILMIPVFVTLAIYYGESIQRGEPLEWQRFAAIIVFLLAAVSDGLDGYVARRYNQRSSLGVILDPIADKGLLLERHHYSEHQQLEPERSRLRKISSVVSGSRHHARRRHPGRRRCSSFAERQSARETELDRQSRDRLQMCGDRVGDVAAAFSSFCPLSFSLPEFSRSFPASFTSWTACASCRPKDTPTPKRTKLR